MAFKMPNKNQWELTEYETGKQYAAFQRYKEMRPEERSLKKVSEELGKDYTNIRFLSAKFKWVERAAYWDSHVAKIAEREQLRKVKEMNRRHEEESKMIQSSLLTLVREFRNRIEGGCLNELATKDFIDKFLRAVQLLPVVADMERKAMGEATEISKNDITSGGNEIKVILPSINNEADNV